MTAPALSAATIPDRLEISASRKTPYARQTRQISSADAVVSGLPAVRMRESLKTSEISIPPIAPISSEPRKMKTKMPTDSKTIAAVKSSQPLTPIRVVCESCRTTLKSTIETASLRTDSPKISAFSFGSAPVEPKIASVATGSTAEMSAANAAASIGVSSPVEPPRP